MSQVRISKKTITFLKSLAKNNNRDWFKANRALYDEAIENVIEVSEAILEGLGRSDSISTISGKKSLFRIHRDVRFSKDKTPYNTWFSGSFTRAGADRRGGYYYMIAPKGEAIVGGGFWSPNKEDLFLVRQQIAMDDEPLRNVIESKEFRNMFGEMKGQQLKTAPKGFDKEHPSIDLLRYKQYLVMRHLSEAEILSVDFVDIVRESFEGLRPFFDAMTLYLTTDLNGESTI